VEIDEIATEEFKPQDTFADNPQFELGEHLLDSLTPTLASSPVEAPGDVGLTSGLPTDLGTLMAGGGNGEAGGGRVGSASFFGTRSEANRVVFVIDNSSSMKGGRLETAVAELLRSVEGMSTRQSFYVIFVSDRPYAMFYPEPASALLPATEPNQQRLRRWLGGLQLAGGKNRELIKAMDMAAALRPETVFFLWDGRIDNAGVRRDVMLHLTRPQPWDFTIHTLGMGVVEPEHEQNLAAVAEAHGGTYLRVDTATRSAR
jgi:von Willebrand factor type A domain